MSNFRRELSAIDPAEMQELARQLLGKLGGTESRNAPQRQFYDGDTQNRADKELYQTEESYPQKQRGFYEDVMQEARQRQFPEHRLDESNGRSFDDMDFAAAVKRDFSDPALPGARAEKEVLHTGASADYAMKGRNFFQSHAADRYREMEEISDFFRRDGRRYDGGFKQY